MNANAQTQNSMKGSDLLKSFFQKREAGSIVAIVVLCIILTLSTDRFLTVNNLLNVARQISTLSIAAVGMTLVVITAGIDLSAGSTMAMCAVVAAKLIFAGYSPVLGILCALLTGLAIGLINGYLIAYVQLPAFIATLGSNSAFRGLAMLLTGGWPVTLIPTPEQRWFFFLGGGYLFGVVPMQAVTMIVVLIIGAVMLKKSVFGHRIYAVGGNERAATLAGIPSRRIKLLAYTILGFLCGIVGILTVAFVQTAEPTFAQGMEQDVIAAVVIGGGALSGGEGSITGAFLGAITIGILLNGLTLLGASPFIQKILIGVVIIFAVILSERVRKTIR